MADEQEFQKPKSTGPSVLPNAASFNVNVAREMVNMHLLARNPQNHQSSLAIHARIRPKAGAAAPEALSLGSLGNHGFFLPAPASGLSTKTPFVTTRSRPQNTTDSDANEQPGFEVSNLKAVLLYQDVAHGVDGPLSQPPTTSNACLQTKARVSVPATSHTGPCTNPQCYHCGTVIIPSPKATWPAQEQPSISVNDWSIYTRKGPICLSDELDLLNDTRFDFPLPEMIFGKNRVLLINDKTGARIDFNTLDALDSLAPTADFKVAYHKEWLSTRPKAKASDAKNGKALDDSFCPSQATRPTESCGTVSSASSVNDAARESLSLSLDLQSVKPYDWTYSTNYRGTLSQCKFTETTQSIPLDKLVRPDPILFYDEAVLFEDELGDNGISMLSTKIRVMHSCLLLLCRFSMRVDDVAFRIRDTRVYIDLETNVVLREYKTQQALYSELLSRVSNRSIDPKKLLRDSNWVSQNTPVILREVEVMGSG